MRENLCKDNTTFVNVTQRLNIILLYCRYRILSVKNVLSLTTYFD